MYKLDLIVGDGSGDGHEKKQSVSIECSLLPTKLEAAFKAGSLLVCGDDNLNGLCRDYEDRLISKDLINKLSTFGINVEDYAYQNCDDEFEFEICDAENFVNLYMKVAEIGNKKLKWQFLPQGKRLCIGGYGLFY